MFTLADILSDSKKYLKKHKVSDYVISAEEIICKVLHCSREELFFYDKKKILLKEKKEIKKLLEKRAIQKTPLAYLLGFVYFYDCRIEVTKDVFIPRIETEEMVAKIIKILEKEDLRDKVLWDIATGSGCMGIVLKKRFPQLKVIISDISKKALKIARKNAKINHVEIEKRKGDLFAAFKKEEKAHFIVCNPPYIEEKEIENLPRDVKDYEPILALNGKEEGLAFYKRFFHKIPFHLYHGGKVFFEIGENQKERLKEIFSKNLSFQLFFTKDLFKKDRFFFLEFE